LDQNFIRKIINKFKGNPNLAASFLHYVGDTFSSIIVLANGILSTVFQDTNWIPYVDPICGCFIVIIILMISLPLIRTVSVILLQKTPADVDVIKIQEK
jgi:Co/Zn/Cd efflux system component